MVKVKLKFGQKRTGFEVGEETEWPYDCEPNPDLFDIEKKIQKEEKVKPNIESVGKVGFKLPKIKPRVSVKDDKPKR